MPRIKQFTLCLGLVAALCLWSAPQAVAQQTIETFSEVIDVTVTSGTVVYRNGQTVVLNIKEGTHKGLQKFVFGSNAKIMRNGVPAQVTDLRKGDRIVQTTITTRRAPVKITMAEVEQMMEDAPAPQAAPAPPAPMPEALPVELPKTATQLPAALFFGVLSSLFGLAILGRRFAVR